jgi:hypothetical protein
MGYGKIRYPGLRTTNFPVRQYGVTVLWAVDRPPIISQRGLYYIPMSHTQRQALQSCCSHTGTYASHRD